MTYRVLSTRVAFILVGLGIEQTGIKLLTRLGDSKLTIIESHSILTNTLITKYKFNSWENIKTCRLASRFAVNALSAQGCYVKYRTDLKLNLVALDRSSLSLKSV